MGIFVHAAYKAAYISERDMDDPPTRLSKRVIALALALAISDVWVT